MSSAKDKERRTGEREKALRGRSVRVCVCGTSFLPVQSTTRHTPVVLHLVLCVGCVLRGHKHITKETERERENGTRRGPENRNREGKRRRKAT